MLYFFLLTSHSKLRVCENLMGEERVIVLCSPSYVERSLCSININTLWLP
jgi:hypothetical protein